VSAERDTETAARCSPARGSLVEPVGGLRDGHLILPEGMAAKVKDGHTFEADSPGGLSSVARATCTTCGDAVLDFRGNVYGGATERTCAESLVFWGVTPISNGPSREASS
jgi:hypothetical protein